MYPNDAPTSYEPDNQQVDIERSTMKARGVLNSLLGD